ncbi:MAG: hypothetical protein WCK26_03520 [Candidatus Saccharibacteria bacterium]
MKKLAELDWINIIGWLLFISSTYFLIVTIGFLLNITFVNDNFFGLYYWSFIIAIAIYLAVRFSIRLIKK